MVLEMHRWDVTKISLGITALECAAGMGFPSLSFLAYS